MKNIVDILWNALRPESVQAILSSLLSFLTPDATQDTMICCMCCCCDDRCC